MEIKRCYPVLVGASVAENQLLTNLSSRSQTLGITITANSDGSITATGTASADNNLWFKQNFPFTANRVYLLKGSKGNGYLGLSGSYTGRDIGNGCLYKFSSAASPNIVYGFTANTTYNETLFPEIIDLTKKLGSSIADYAYTLEQATAGSGLAWLRSYGFISDDYIPYNTGTIESVEATAKVVRDENGENAVTYPLGSDVLRGIFKLDANNQLYADGDRKTSDGVVTRKYLQIDLGTLDWRYVASGGDTARFQTTNLMNRAKAPANNNMIFNGICPIYETNTITMVANIADYDMGIGMYTTGMVEIRNSAYSDAAAFKAAMSGVMLVYELATPTTEQSTPFQSPQVCYPDGTEEFVTENHVPVGHETEYQL